MLEWLAELTGIFICVYYIIKAIIKDTDERPDKEMGARTGRVPSSEASVHCPGTKMCSMI